MPTGVHISDKVRKEIELRLKRGEQIKFIQYDLGVSRMAIWRISKSAGIRPRHRMNERRDRAMKLIESGASINKTAKEIGVDRSTVIRWKKKSPD